jgi:hypothetical protein
LGHIFNDFCRALEVLPLVEMAATLRRFWTGQEVDLCTQLSPADKKPFPKMNQPPITSQAAGYLSGGLPYNRLGHGPRLLVIFQGWAIQRQAVQAGCAGILARGVTDVYIALVQLLLVEGCFTKEKKNNVKTDDKS